MTKAEAVQALQSLKSRFAHLKEDAKRIAQLGTASALTVAGGAAAGVLAVKMPKLPGTEIQSDVALGSACVGVALMGWGDKYAEQLCSLGAGMLAVVAARETQKALS
jgi:hypothetical protein